MKILQDQLRNLILDVSYLRLTVEKMKSNYNARHKAHML